MTMIDVLPSEGPYLPKGTRGLLARLAATDRHPGLQLDKFSAGGRQKDRQRPALEEVCRAGGDQGLLDAVLNRRAGHLVDLRATRFQAQTVGPLTLHLSRASALENAGICLHPLYGFVYLPGSGLKGMARAWATTTGVPAEEIEAVFGWAAKTRGSDDAGSIGTVVFHDAWPITWPRLSLDVLTNHHPGYYQEGQPPGDWEDPKPAFFLAVGPGASFDFALSARAGVPASAGHAAVEKAAHPSVGDDGRAPLPALSDKTLVERAEEWLLAALEHRGAGAKTNAGYGSFRRLDPGSTKAVAAAKLPREAGLSFETTLTLITPGFFAGAEQYLETPLPSKSAKQTTRQSSLVQPPKSTNAPTSCDLRSASLRGQLRWWWRTLHAGFVPLPELRRLEAMIWGDTTRSGAVRVEVERDPSAPFRSSAYDKKERQAAEQLPRPGRVGTQPLIQGLWYGGYGADEEIQIEKVRRQRYVVEPGAKYTLRLKARSISSIQRNTSEPSPPPVAADTALTHARHALYLLTRYGAVGLKSRKGFGCFADIDFKDVPDLATLQREARRLVPGTPQTDCKSPALTADTIVAEWSLPKKSTWQSIDTLWSAIQTFAKGLRPSERRVALGLPRRIGRLDQTAKNGSDRHAAPYFIHVAPRGSDTLVRFIGFPQAYLPDWDASVRMLTELKSHLETSLPRDRGQLEAHPAAAAAPDPSRADRALWQGRLPDGKRVSVIGENETQYHIRFPSGRKAWIEKERVTRKV